MALSDWLTEHRCTHIAMEATSVYWKLVWHILADGDFQPSAQGLYLSRPHFPSASKGKNCVAD
jgi:hypothetical protein